MRIKLITQKDLDALKVSIADNLTTYRSGLPFEFDDLIDTGIEVDDIVLHEGNRDTDYDNILTVYRALRPLSASITRDERFWVYCTHSLFVNYTTSRWPLPEDDEKAVTSVGSHYFASNEREIESRNAISRLYWIGHVADRCEIDLEETLRVITWDSNVLHSVIERPGALQLPAVFQALVSRLSRSRAGNGSLFKRDTFREVQKAINVACGSTFVECLSAAQAQRLVDGAIESVMARNEETLQVAMAA